MPAASALHAHSLDADATPAAGGGRAPGSRPPPPPPAASHEWSSQRARATDTGCACLPAGIAGEEGPQTESGDEITGTQGGADDTLLPPGGWFPFVLIILSLMCAVGISKHLEKNGRPGGEYGVVDH